jgi:ABC-type transporter Mla subunit MlaD
MPRPPDGLTKAQRDEARLRQQLAAVQAERAAKLTQTARLEAQLRRLAREQRGTLQAEVGKLADAAGLLAFDLPTLEKAFARLAEALGSGEGTA